MDNPVHAKPIRGFTIHRLCLSTACRFAGLIQIQPVLEMLLPHRCTMPNGHESVLIHYALWRTRTTEYCMPMICHKSDCLTDISVSEQFVSQGKHGSRYDRWRLTSGFKTHQVVSYVRSSHVWSKNHLFLKPGHTFEVPGNSSKRPRILFAVCEKQSGVCDGWFNFWKNT